MKGLQRETLSPGDGEGVFASLHRAEERLPLFFGRRGIGEDVPKHVLEAGLPLPAEKAAFRAVWIRRKEVTLPRNSDGEAVAVVEFRGAKEGKQKCVVVVVLHHDGTRAPALPGIANRSSFYPAVTSRDAVCKAFPLVPHVDPPSLVQLLVIILGLVDRFILRNAQLVRVYALREYATAKHASKLPGGVEKYRVRRTCKQAHVPSVVLR